MNQIGRTGRWNPGGGRWLELLAVVGLAAMTGPTITLRDGFSWTRIYTTPGQLQYTDRTTDTDNGTLHKIDVRGWCPDDDAARRAAFDQLLQYKHVIMRYCDNSGLIRLVGTSVEHLQFGYTLATGSDVPDARGYSLTISGSMTTAPLYV